MIRKHTLQYSLYVISGLLFIMTISACMHHAKPDSAMLFHAGMGLEEAVSKSMNDLENPELHTQFDRYFEGLVEIAENNPDSKNKQIFSEFLLFANRKGILTKHMAQDYYNRYFNITFMSLPDNYNISSACYDRTKILADMETELLQKERGLLKACQDKSNYYLAYDHYNTIRIVYNATCMASTAKR